MIKILGNGYIGSKIKGYYKDKAVLIPTLNIPFPSLNSLLSATPGPVINCVGYTGRTVDDCETHQWETLEANVSFPTAIAKICKDHGLYMVHISSGCIYADIETEFTTRHNWAEEDPPNFNKSFYSLSKILAEDILKHFSNVLQVRIRMPLDKDDSPKNLINKLKNYKKIINIKNSITVLPDFLQALDKLIEKRATGIYNVVNPDPVTHAEILNAYRDATGEIIKFEIISKEEFAKVVTAPRANCTLSIEKLQREGISMPKTTDSIYRLFKCS